MTLDNLLARRRLEGVLGFWLAVAATAALEAGEPWRRHTIDDSSRGADGVRLADVNGDGLPDIATGWEEGGRIRGYLNPGPARARARWPAVTVGEVRSPEDAVFVDLDADGAVDVVSCCEGRNRSIFFHWAPSRQNFLDATAWRTAAVPCVANRQSWMFALPMQIDGRRGIDLVVASKGAGAEIGWLESPAQPRNVGDWKYHSLQPAGWIMSLRAVDMDGDGDADILASDRRGPTRGVLWLENPGNSPDGEASPDAADVKWAAHRIGAADREVLFLTTIERGARRPPTVVAAVRGRGLAWLEPAATDPVSWTLTEIPMPDGCGTGKGVAAGDIDGNGNVDLVFSCENAQGELSGVRWLSRDTTPGAPPRWQDHEISGREGVKFDRLELLDMDGDGDLDVLTCEERDNLGVIWYENPSLEPHGSQRRP